MSVKLVFLGRLEDEVGASECAVAPGSFAEVLAEAGPAVASAVREPFIRVALNGVLVTEPEQLVMVDGDELAFLPPVSGG